MKRFVFILMYRGEVIDEKTTDDYEVARRYCYNEYFTFDRGCRVFVDGKEITIFEAYNYFKLSEYSINYIFHKTL